VCHEGACLDPPGEGEPCTEECAGNLQCVYNDQAMLVCSPRAPDGSACAVDDECASGHCAGADPMTGAMGSCAVDTTCDGM